MFFLTFWAKHHWSMMLVSFFGCKATILCEVRDGEIAQKIVPKWKCFCSVIILVNTIFINDGLLTMLMVDKRIGVTNHCDVVWNIYGMYALTVIGHIRRHGFTTSLVPWPTFKTSTDEWISTTLFSIHEITLAFNFQNFCSRLNLYLSVV